ncbi:hypothetical protein EVAR_12662_1 [Eumeta japonica]|uniref:Inner centromere protein n=1 Tax=Eumeta variegata TaxID=151549 RepID=A0A4C1ZVL0_EUMVA|nr:hypothetical protein EVAR_12662_1 [Eumeta japonica]
MKASDQINNGASIPVAGANKAMQKDDRIVERFEKFLEEYENEQKQKSHLQRINEDEDEQDEILNVVKAQALSHKSNAVNSQSHTNKVLPGAQNEEHPQQKTNEGVQPETQSEKQSKVNETVPVVQDKDITMKSVSRKRVKEEVDDTISPEVHKRQKRSASDKAQNTINKMVNMNLNQKLRRDNTTEEQRSNSRQRKGRKGTEGNKENTPPPIIIKQEKISIPAEEQIHIETLLTAEKKERVSELVMPPPPIPKPRRLVKEKSKDNIAEGIEELEQTGRRSRAKAKKQADVPPVARRSARVNSRTALTEDSTTQEPAAPAQEIRPKRTKKKQLKEISNQSKDDTQQPLENSTNKEDTPEKPRTKRTRKVPRKYIDDQDSPKKTDHQPHIEKKDEVKTPEQQENVAQSTKIPIPIGKPVNNLNVENVVSSPILQMKTKMNFKNKVKDSALEKQDRENVNEIEEAKLDLEKTRILNIDKNVTVTLSKTYEMNSTVVLPSGKFNHDPVTPKAVKKMDETVVIEKANIGSSAVKTEPRVVNDPLVLNKESTPHSNVLTDDNSLLTDDNSEEEHTPPRSKEQEETAPNYRRVNPHLGFLVQSPRESATCARSAVKEKVQQFEEMATRMTRTKTRAMTKKVEEDNETPPDKAMRPKPALSVETLSKLNNLIFNGKPPTTSSSATKPKVNNVISNVKSFIPNSTSKMSAVAKAKEAAEESLKKEKEDARTKREALLKAKREEQKRKREEKMAAAAAAREAAERERRIALEAALKERMEKQAHADLGKLERQKEAERKKQELAKKVAETEERRRAEEQARLQKLAEDQKRAELARKKQQEEAEATKREVALATKELEKRKKEYMEKQKLQQQLENNRMNTPLRTPGKSGVPLPPMEPVHMADGFQYLDSEDDDYDKPSKKPDPAWSKSEVTPIKVPHKLKRDSSEKSSKFANCSALPKDDRFVKSIATYNGKWISSSKQSKHGKSAVDKGRLLESIVKRDCKRRRYCVAGRTACCGTLLRQLFRLSVGRFYVNVQKAIFQKWCGNSFFLMMTLGSEKRMKNIVSNLQARLHQLRIQSAVNVELIDKMFSVRQHTPDLREIFPNISRHALKRTSSAVWRTPPTLKLPSVPE